RLLEVAVEAVAAAGAVPGRARGRAERAPPLRREPGQVVGEPRRLGVLQQRDDDPLNACVEGPEKKLLLDMAGAYERAAAGSAVGTDDVREPLTVERDVLGVHDEEVVAGDAEKLRQGWFGEQAQRAENRLARANARSQAHEAPPNWSSHVRAT